MARSLRRGERAEMVKPSRTRSIITTGAFIALATIFLAPGIFAGKVPAFRDLLVLFLPLRWYAREAIRSGRFPLWIPHLFFGAPFFANYQASLLYPPSLILYTLPWPSALSLYLALHLFIGGFGMTRYLQRQLALGPVEATLGGIVFAFGGFFTSLISLTNQLQVAAWLPWVLDGSGAVLGGDRRRGGLTFVLALSLQMLGGAPEALLMTLALVALQCAQRWWESAAAWREVRLLSGLAILPVLLTAAQLLPTAEYVLQTDRADVLSYDSVTAESLAPRSLLQLLIPHTFIEGGPAFVPEGRVPLFWSLYVGIVPLALALVGAAARRCAWVGALVIGTLLSFGSATPLLPVLYQAFPRLVGAFRFPTKFFLIAHTAVAVLAAYGLARVATQSTARRTLGCVLFGCLLAGSGIWLWSFASPGALLRVFGFTLPSDVSESVERLLAGPLQGLAIRLAGISIVALGVLWLCAREAASPAALATALTVIAVCDLLPIHQPALGFTNLSSLSESLPAGSERFSQGARLFHYCTTGASCRGDTAPGLTAWSGGLRPGEKLEGQVRHLWSALIPDLPIVYGLGAVAGSDGFATRDQRAFFQTLASLPRDQSLHLLAALGVEGLAGPEPLANDAVTQVAAGDVAPTRWLYALREPAPRVYLAERVFYAVDASAALRRMAADFSPGRDVVLMREASESPDAAGGTIEDASLQEEEASIRVRLPAAGFLVLGDTWFPGWRATVDGGAVEIRRANGFQRAVALPAGEHRVHLVYRPRSFSWGLVLSGIGLVLTLTIFARLHRESRT